MPHPTPFCAAPTHFFHYLSAPIIFQTSFHLPPSSLNPSSPSQPLSVPSELCIYIHLFIILDSLARLWKTCVIYFHFQNSSILLFTVTQFYCNSASCSLTFHFSHFLLHSTLPLLFDFAFKGCARAFSASPDTREWKEKQEKGERTFDKGRNSRSKYSGTAKTRFSFCSCWVTWMLIHQGFFLVSPLRLLMIFTTSWKIWKRGCHQIWTKTRGQLGKWLIIALTFFITNYQGSLKKVGIQLP